MVTEFLSQVEINAGMDISKNSQFLTLFLLLSGTVVTWALILWLIYCSGNPVINSLASFKRKLLIKRSTIFYSKSRKSSKIFLSVKIKYFLLNCRIMKIRLLKGFGSILWATEAVTMTTKLRTNQIKHPKYMRWCHPLLGHHIK